MIDEELIREEKRNTHFRRYMIVANKVVQFANEMQEKKFMETTDHLRYSQLMEEAHEALLDSYKDLVEDIKIFEEKIK